MLKLFFFGRLMERLESYPDLHFDVRFTLSRFPFYVMHRSIDLLVNQGMLDMVFPPGTSMPLLHIQGDIQ